jgi:hypothetical protein
MAIQQIETPVLRIAYQSGPAATSGGSFRESGTSQPARIRGGWPICSSVFSVV